MIQHLKTSLAILLILLSIFNLHAELKLKEIRTASNNVLVVYFTSDTLNLDEVDISDNTAWKINGKPALAISRYITKADMCDHNIYLQTSKLVEGAKYLVETPYGKKEFQFKEREILCESIKNNQMGYSALSKTRYANFAIWLGTGGGKKIEGPLPDYEVFEQFTGKVVAKGKLKELGKNKSSGDFVYRIDLAKVPEGGPYKIVVKGYGSSFPFGVGGEFMKKTAYILFRA